LVFALTAKSLLLAHFLLVFWILKKKNSSLNPCRDFPGDLILFLILCIWKLSIKSSNVSKRRLSITFSRGYDFPLTHDLPSVYRKEFNPTESPMPTPFAWYLDLTPNQMFSTSTPTPSPASAAILPGTRLAAYPPAGRTPTNPSI
jgi:hypothetical protein